MEPEVIRIYSSSPPPMDDGTEEEDSEFGDFGTFSAVAASISFTELDTPTTFNQTQALNATSPPELLAGRGVLAFGRGGRHGEALKANGVAGHRGDVPSDRTESKGVLAGSPGHPESEAGRGPEVLTNGFVSPSLQDSGHARCAGTSAEDPEDDFADFASFSDAEGGVARPEAEDALRDPNRTRTPESESGPAPAEAPDPGPGPHQRTDAACTNRPATLNGLDAADGASEAERSQNQPADGETERVQGKSSDTETETETSLGRPLSTDALEEYGDTSTPGSVPSPPLQGETATPADHSQLAEDGEDDEDDEDFGDFGDAAPGFPEFEQEAEQDRGRSHSSAPSQQRPEDGDEDFGDFDSPRERQDGPSAELPVSDSFGNFSSAADAQEADAGWSAFGEAEQPEGAESWAAFSTEPSTCAPPEGGEEEEVEEEEEEEEEVEERAAAPGESSSTTTRFSTRLQKLFLSSFPQTAVPGLDQDVPSLRSLLGPAGGGDQPGGEGSLCNRSVWTRLQDIHEAFGLRHQWGGSHCNKVLLSCLGIDTRNILFTGQKKQPVIVPMYAASLGMLEPTKEPLKPMSAAEMIASIAQTPPVAAESADSVQQEALPPIQFDWSSSGLTNPLDASGGSSLLNLDFFGPVEDSGSASSASMPGVDPELYELTTAKLDLASSSSRVVDAFARLMSTMEKTSTSTRKPRKEENLSEEAAKVIAGLPDLSFMQAKVLMFPATLTPLDSQSTPD